jgi:hypothetical protein
MTNRSRNYPPGDGSVVGTVRRWAFRGGCFSRAGLGASDDVLDDLASVVSPSPTFTINTDGSSVMREHRGRGFVFRRLNHFRGDSSSRAG